MCNICHKTSEEQNIIEFKCSHEMCKSCFIKWTIISNNEDAKKNITCPYCRTDILCSIHVNHERAFLRENMTEIMDEYETPSCSQEQEYLESSLIDYIE